MKEIQLTQGKVAFVDDCDFEALNQFKWCYHNGYAVRATAHPNRKLILMHREILQIHGIQAEQCDHIDRNSTNNILKNLRPATNQQNSHNRGPNKNNTTGFKGVIKRGLKYRTQIWHGGKCHYFGTYATPEEAAHARDKGAIELQGEFVYLNFPQDTPESP